MSKWTVIFRELREALAEAKKKYKHLKDSSTIRIRILLTSKEIQHYKAPLSEVEKKIWDLADEHSNIIYFCVETSRNLPIYSTTRYNLVQGEGSTGDPSIIKQFAEMTDERKDLLVRLLHSQIQDEITKDCEVSDDNGA